MLPPQACRVAGVPVQPDISQEEEQLAARGELRVHEDHA